MEKLNTIQKRENLNYIYPIAEEIGPGGAHHCYIVGPNPERDVPEKDRGLMIAITFQNGPRKAQDSQTGVLDCDLLEIVRDRLKAFQSGPMASEYNAQALIHVEEALMWMNRRVEDRIERGVLGTMEK